MVSITIKTEMNNPNRYEDMRSIRTSASIIILNFNGAKVIEPCLRNVFRSDYPNFEVILVDNASTDGSIERVEKSFNHYKNLKIIRNRINLGFAGGNNIGVSNASGEYIVLLNNDTEVENNWLTEIIKVMNSNSNIAVAQSLLLSHSDRSKIDGGLSYINTLGYGAEKGFGEDKNKLSKVTETFYANGAAMTIRRDALIKIQSFPALFDQNYFAYYEDVDLCWRLRLAGFRVVLAPKSIVYHHKAVTSSKRVHIFVFYHCRNRIITLVKNYSLENLLKFLPLLIMLELARATLHFLLGRASFGISIIKAIMWNALNFRKTWIKHLQIQISTRRVPDSAIIQYMDKLNLAQLWRNFFTYRDFSQKRLVVH